MDQNYNLDEILDKLNYHDLNVIFNDHVILKLLNFLKDNNINQTQLFNVYKKCQVIKYTNGSNIPFFSNQIDNVFREFLTKTSFVFQKEYNKKLELIKNQIHTEQDVNFAADQQLQSILFNNLYEIYNNVFTFSKIEPNTLQIIHATINAKINPNLSNTFRMNNDTFSGRRNEKQEIIRIYTPLDYKFIPQTILHILDQFYDVIENQTSYERIIVCLKLFYDIIAIQPFSNGNTHVAMKILMQLLWTYCSEIRWLRFSPLVIEAILTKKMNNLSFKNNYTMSFITDLQKWYTTNASSSIRNIRFWLATIIQCCFAILEQIASVYTNNTNKFTVTEQSYITKILTTDYTNILKTITTILQDPQSNKEYVLSTKK